MTNILMAVILAAIAGMAVTIQSPLASTLKPAYRANRECIHCAYWRHDSIRYYFAVSRRREYARLARDPLVYLAGRCVRSGRDRFSEYRHRPIRLGSNGFDHGSSPTGIRSCDRSFRLAGARSAPADPAANCRYAGDGLGCMAGCALMKRKASPPLIYFCIMRYILPQVEQPAGVFLQLFPG